MTMLDQMRRHMGWLKWSLGLVVLAFSPLIEEVAGPQVAVVDSAFTTALAAEDLLDALGGRSRIADRQTQHAPAEGSSRGLLRDPARDLFR